MPFYIRYDASDNAPAIRPVLRNPHHSPAIFFTDPLDPLITIDEPQVTQPTKIRVKVETNEAGAPPPPPLNITVQVWVCDYTVGGIGPASVVGPMGADGLSTAAGEGVVAPALPAGSSAVVAVFDWTPTTAEFENVDPATGKAHMCMGANAFDAGEGAFLNAGFLDIHGEEHHAQKNIAILPAPGGMAKIRFAAQNPSKKEGIFFIEAKPVRQRLGRPELEQLLATPFVDLVGGRPFDPRKLLREGFELAEPIERHMLRRGGKLVLGRDRRAVHPGRGPLKQLELEHGSQSGRRLKLKLPPASRKKTFVTAHVSMGDAERGAVRSFEVTQTTEQGIRVGGGRVVVVNVSRKDLKGQGR